jgi:hypothetical protein
MTLWSYTTLTDATPLGQASRSQHPPDGMSYDAPTDCRVDEPHGFDGAPVYLCAISIVGQGPSGGHLWEWGALIDGTLRTHTPNGPRRDPDDHRTLGSAVAASMRPRRTWPERAKRSSLIRSREDEPSTRRRRGLIGPAFQQHRSVRWSKPRGRPRR